MLGKPPKGLSNIVGDRGLLSDDQRLWMVR